MRQKIRPPPLLSSRRASTLRASTPAFPATRRRFGPPPRCGGGHRVGLRAERTPGCDADSARPRRAQGHAPRGGAAGTSGYRRARRGVLRQRPALLGRGRGGTRIPPRRRVSTRDRRHHQRRQLVEGTTRGRRQHAAAERGLVPDRDRVHGGRIERGVAARERRRRDDRATRARRGRPPPSPPDALAVTSVGVRRPVRLHRRSSATAPRRGPPTAPTSGRAGSKRASSPRRSSPVTTSRALPAARASSPATSRPATVTGRARSR